MTMRRENAACEFSAFDCVFNLHRVFAHASRAIWNPANDCRTGITSMRLTLRCGGRLAIQKIVSAMSSAVIGSAPL